MAERVILVDDEAEVREAIGQSLELAGLSVEPVASAARALELIGPDFDGIVVSDIRMPRMDGMSFLSLLKERDPDLPVILMTGHGDVPLAVQAMRAGAQDFVEKPFDGARLVEAVERALHHRRLALENRAMRRTLENRDELEALMVGRAPAIIALRQHIRTIGASPADVLITGETGAGKEIAARALHMLSDRAERPMVAINMAALPAAMIESELFGHEAGAFAGAMKARFGKFEHARGGTVFLDEIDALSMDLQAKLLRVIEERQVVRVGSNDPVKLDLRFIAASKADLARRVEEGSFRADLYYRLAVVAIDVPPLSARIEDIPRLFQHLVNQAALRHRRPVPEVPTALFAELAGRDWPGNVRELRNAADRFVLGLPTSGPVAEGLPSALPDRVERFERAAIAAELAGQGGNVKATYEALGISRKTLYEKMVKYGLERARFARET